MAALALPWMHHPGGRWQSAIALRPYPGQMHCGDQAGLWCLGEGRVLLALADGLGHGTAAVDAAWAAMACIDSAPGLALGPLLQRCDEALRTTRGAALSLIHLDLEAGLLEHAGIGNVCAAVWCGAVKRRISSVPGIVGTGLPAVRTDTFNLDSQGLLAHYSDGIDPMFELTDKAGNSLPAQADQLVARYGRPHDDAGLVLLRWDADTAIVGGCAAP